MTRHSFLICTLCLLLAACAGMTSNSQQAIGTLEPVPSEYAGMINPFGSEAVTDGSIIFKSYCETCHGAQGHGDGPAASSLDPQPRNLALLQAAAADDYLHWRILEGRQGTAMPAWKGILTEEQVWQVIAFIRTLK